MCIGQWRPLLDTLHTPAIAHTCITATWDVPPPVGLFMCNFVSLRSNDFYVTEWYIIDYFLTEWIM
jgi:hypothetical protein